MATTETNNENAHDSGNNSLTLGLAMLAGLGMTLMIVAAGIGVIGGAGADQSLVTWLFLGGTALFLAGAFGWAGVVRPWEQFDDINQPLYHGHDHEHDHHDEHDHHESSHHDDHTQAALTTADQTAH